MTLQANDPMALDGVLRREFPYPLVFTAGAWPNAPDEALTLVYGRRTVLDNPLCT